jgi:hypothetical protein
LERLGAIDYERKVEGAVDGQFWRLGPGLFATAVCEEQTGKAKRVILIAVREEDGVDVGWLDAALLHCDGGAPAGVDQDVSVDDVAGRFFAGFNAGTGYAYEVDGEGHEARTSDK